ncbi:MAG: archaeosine biosynthesis radical SAM protein RaSEA [Candidatus Thermoplasmatota archaeon]
MHQQKLKKEIENVHERTSRSEETGLVTYWDEKEFYSEEGKAVDVFSLIFRTRGCSWSYTSGCSMCGYYTDTNPYIGDEDLREQLERALTEYDGQDIVKIYTSGSFFDEREIDERLALEILQAFEAEKIVVESRPEFIDVEKIESYSKKVDTLEVALGLESADDFVLKNCINKGFTFGDYKEKVKQISEHVSIRTYLLLKPPFLFEKEAIDDIIESIRKIEDLTDIVSINPVNVQRGTLVEKLWKKNLYRPPWLWSIIEILSEEDVSDTTVFISEAAIGSKRGAHNCGECEDRFKQIIHDYNLTQDDHLLKDVTECSCRERWKKETNIEPFLFFRGTPELLRSRHPRTHRG